MKMAGVYTEHVFATQKYLTTPCPTNKLRLVATSKSCYLHVACERIRITVATLWEHTFTLLNNKSLV